MKKELTTKVTMTLKEITDLLETRHNDAMRIVEKMMENQEFGTATKISYQYTKGNNATGTIKTYQLNKRQSIAVASRLNTPYLMRLIDRLEELEAKQPPAPWDKPPVQKLIGNQTDSVTALEMLAETFNVTGTEKIKMFSTGLAQYPNLVKALPSYNSSKFVGTVGEVSERVAHAYSYHKKVYGFELSAVAFNRLLIANGLLHNETSSSGKVFKSIVGEGLEYGKNVSPKQNSTQTQPHWYDDTIEDLYYSVAVE